MTRSDEAARWRALLHRWFIQYNPLYLLSAALVLGGATVLSREVAQHHVAYGGVAVGALAELYAFALIGGAACLTRMGLRRPAVLLALLAVLYQCDLTLQVETYVWYGGVGVAASAAWLGLFVAKLFAIVRALRLRAARSAYAVPTLGALGLAVFPHLLREVDGSTGSQLVGAWVFALVVAGLWTNRTLRSLDGFDVRGLRAVRGTWLLWSAAALAHVAFWATEPDLDLSLFPIVPALVLASARWIRRERTLWALCVATLTAVAVVSPASLSLTGFMVAAVFGLHLLRRPQLASPEARDAVLPPHPVAVFRSPPAAWVAPPVVLSTPATTFARASSEATRRHLVGLASALYLGLWTQGWTGGAAPDHLLALDVVFLLGCAAYAWRARTWLALAPVGAVPLQLGVQLSWIGLPRNALEAGGAAVGLGFVLLAVGLAVTWRLQRSPQVAPFEAPDDREPSPFRPAV